MTCPFLEYRSEANEHHDGFDEPRAYCGAAEQFVQPMRADICNDRYDLSHDEHCEIYLEHADEVSAGTETGNETENAGQSAGDGA